MMRMAFSGAASRASLSQTPRAFRRSTELVSSAAVLVSTARVLGAGAGPISDDLGAHMRQRQRGDEARRAGADHGNIAHGMDFRHLAIAAFDRPEKTKE